MGSLWLLRHAAPALRNASWLTHACAVCSEHLFDTHGTCKYHFGAMSLASKALIKRVQQAVAPNCVLVLFVCAGTLLWETDRHLGCRTPTEAHCMGLIYGLVAASDLVSIVISAQSSLPDVLAQACREHFVCARRFDVLRKAFGLLIHLCTMF